MKDITSFISPLVESQFPSFYREEGPQFITLIKSYYEWLEQSNNALYHARRLLEYRDIDQTVDDFIVYFKEETLKNIQFDVATNKRLLAKNALDFYRSKGTARSVDLFFKLVYAQPAKVYYPGDDVFKLSDNTWKIPEYLEVTNTVYNPDFEGKQITGIRSGATAFVENYSIKKKINNQVDAEGNEVKISKDIHVFYITNVRGDFEFGETVVHSGTEDPRKAPKMIGSLSELQVITGASDYVVGDIVNLISNTGFNGKALVTSIANTTGQVEFTLIDGGWGYTTSPKIIISEKALLVNNVIASSGSLSKPFKLFSTLVQPKANINFDTLTGSLAANNLLFSYESGNVTSISKIITISSNTGGIGNMYLSVVSGTLPGVGNVLYNDGNVSSANITLKVDKTSTANIMGVSSNNILLIDDVEGGLLPTKGEQIFQQNSSIGEWVTATVDLVRQEGGKNLIYVTNTVGSFISSQRIRGRASGSNSNLSSYSTTIGIFNPSETSVISVNVVNEGQGYSNGELVTFESEDGFGAVGLVVTYAANSSVSSINILNGGSGYIESPTVRIVNTASPVYFNSNTDVDPVLDFISIPNNGFINAQAIRYTSNTGNTPLTGLVSGFVYYARLANNGGIQLSESPSGNVIQLSKGLTENGHSFTAAVSSGSNFSGNSVLGSPFDYDNKLYVYSVGSNLVSFNASNDVNVTNHFISLNTHPFVNGQSLVYRVGSGRTKLDLLSNNSVYYVGVANSTGIDIAYSNGTIIPITPGVNENGHSFAAYTEANIDLAGEGSLADIRISSLDDEETLRLNTDFIGGFNIYGAPYLNIVLNGSSNSALSGSNSYGFPGKPSGNLINFSIDTILTRELFTIGTISALGTVNPGDDYTLDPFVTIIEPVVAGYRKYDQIMTIDGDTASMTTNENILVSTRKAFDGSSANVISSFIYMSNHKFFANQQVVYTTETGSEVVGGLANNTTYYIVATSSVIDIKITNGGLGYANGPIVFSGGGGTGAVANAVTNEYGNVISIDIQSGGVGYTSAPSISLPGSPSSTGTFTVALGTFNSFGLSLTKGGSKIILTATPSTSFHYIDSGNYEKFGLLKEIINSNTIKVRRLTFINEADPNSETYLKGETSQYVTRLIDSENDETYSGLNSIVEANVITANGVVKTLKIVDSGFAYEQADVMSFQNEDDPEATIGLAKGSNIKQGIGSGFYQNTKGFLSRDKYLHDSDFYQDYSYQIISRVPFERYSNMLKKVLHVSGTRMFPAVEIESKNESAINASKKIDIRTTFNPTSNVDIDENFIRLTNHDFANGELITYSVDDGNTEIKTTTAINGIKAISIVTPGSYYDSTVNNQLSITGSDGNGAIAIFVANSSGNITSVQVLNYGSGYTTTVAPTITAGVANGLSTGATFTVSSYTGIGNNVNYYVAYANSTGFKLSLTANGSSIVNLVAPLSNEVGHGIHRPL